MIVFVNLLQLLSDHGWSTYRLQKEKQIPNGTIIQMRNKKSVSIKTIDKICELCDCQPGDLMHYEPVNKGD